MTTVSEGESRAIEAQSRKKRDVIPFGTFLETVPPNSHKYVALTDRVVKTTGGDYAHLPSDDLLMHCPSRVCGGLRKFRCTNGTQVRSWATGTSDDFQTYSCRNCQISTKKFALRHFIHKGDDETGYAISVVKYGEAPQFGPPTPERLLKLIGDDSSTYLKGRDCENQGFGIGAFSYYRRVVDNQKIHIFDTVIAAADKLDAPADLIAELQAAKSEQQFTRSVTLLTKALPDMLQVQGQNPLKLLYGTLSDGLHGWDDAQCLETASAIRVVLTELADRMAQAMKEERELGDAVARLLKARDTSNGKG